MTGWRKWVLGIVYVLGAYVLIGLAVILGDAHAPALVASVAGATVGVATGLGVIVWGNVQEHKARRGEHHGN